VRWIVHPLVTGAHGNGKPSGAALVYDAASEQATRTGIQCIA
jgi:hypothetical protein